MLTGPLPHRSGAPPAVHTLRREPGRACARAELLAVALLLAAIWLPGSVAAEQSPASETPVPARALETATKQASSAVEPRASDPAKATDDPGSTPAGPAPLPERASTSGDLAPPTSAPSPPTSATTAPETTASGAPNVSAWRNRVDYLLLTLASGRQSPTDADALYRELEKVLWPYHQVVRDSIDAASPGYVGDYAALRALYDERARLIPVLTAKLRHELTSSGELGRAALRNELGYLHTTLRAQLRTIERGLRQIKANLEDSPLISMWVTLQLLAALVVFRVWRRWSKQGLPDARKRLLAMRPRQSTYVRLARLLWYLDRIGGPLAWLILVVVVSTLLQPRGFEELAALIYTVLTWIIVALLAVRYIDAIAARGLGGLREDRAGLRMRSLRVVAAWAVLLGLGLNLVTRYAGDGAIRAWFVFGCEILSIPVAVVLLHWWRGEIQQRLGEIADRSEWALDLAKPRSGVLGYLTAIAGAALLAWVSLLKWFVRRLSGWELGRRVLAVLVRREVARDVASDRYADAEPVPEELVERLLGADQVLIDEVAAEELANLGAVLSASRGGGFVVLTERGSGKSSFLRRLNEQLGGRMRVIRCPAGGYEAFEAELARQLGVPADGDLDASLPEAILAAGIEVLAVDDSHRLARPWMGGQADMDQLSELDARLGGRVTWVLAVDRRAWPYIISSRAERALLQQVITLPPWTEEQLAALVQAHCKAVGIQPDYRHLVLPRQLDAGEYESTEERNRFGHARILWELSDGNPEVALRLFAQSLRALPDGRIMPRLPQPIYCAALNDAQVETLLVLRVVVQCDIAHLDDIVRSLRISESRAMASIRFCVQNDWLCEVEGGWRIDWQYFRTITRTLTRQNLIPR